MAWRKITITDLNEKMTQAEYNVLADVIDGTVATVTSLVRGYVASAGVEMDADTDTLPDRLIGAACAVILVDAYISLGGTLTDPKEHRKQAKEDALRLFRDVAAGKFSIEDPASGTESSEIVTPSYTPTRTRRFTRDSQDGI